MLKRRSAAVAATGLAALAVLLRQWHKRYTARAVEAFLDLLDADAFEDERGAVHAYAAAQHESFERERRPSALPAHVDLVVSGGSFKVCLAGGLTIALKRLGCAGVRYEHPLPLRVLPAHVRGGVGTLPRRASR